MTLFRFFLVDERGEPLDPVTFITAVPNWVVGDTFSLGSGESLRIVDPLATQASGRCGHAALPKEGLS